MPGTLLRDDLERHNASELSDHLQSLFVPDATQAPPALAEPVPVAQPVPDELQAHLDSLLTPDASQAPPVAPAGTSPAQASTPPTNVMDELASHVSDITGGGLQLLNQGLNTLGQGAQTGLQTIGQGLTSLQEPPPPRPAPGPGPATPPGGGPGPSGPLRLDQTASDRVRGQADVIARASGTTGVPASVIAAIMDTEAGGPRSYSPAGAAGFMQVMPQHFRPGEDPFDPTTNITRGAEILADNYKRYGSWDKAAAAYFGAIDARGNITNASDARGTTGSTYVDRFRSNLQRYGSDVTPTAGAETRVTRPTSEFGYSDISQFGDSQLTSDEAYAACGPAAAVRFAQRFGRNPSLKEALDLAKTVGWTSAQGMAGLSSEKALMDRMGVATKLVSGADWGTFANEARTGNPVTISTSGHYFTADGWDPATNKFHVGRSGLDLRRGSEWMTPEQMTSIMGAVQGGLLADNPTVPASTVGTAESFTAPGPGDGVMQAASTGMRSLGEGVNSLGGQAGQGLRSLDQAVQQVGSAARDALNPDFTAPGGPVGQAFSGLGSATQDVLGRLGEGLPGLSEADRTARRQALEQSPLGQAYGSDIRKQLLPNITEPSHPLNVMADLQAKYRDPSDPTGLRLTERMTPEDRQAYEGAMLAIGGTASPVSAEGAAAEAVGRRAGGIDYDALAQLRRRTVQTELPGTPAAEGPNLADKVLAFTVNNVLSNPASLLNNAAGGLIETVKRPIMTATTAGVELATGRPGRAAAELGAAGADLRAMGLAVGDALADAATTFGTGRRVSRAADQPETFEGAAGLVATPFLRVMGATDEFVSGLNSAGAQGAELMRQMRAHPDLSQAEVLQQFQTDIVTAGQHGAAEAIYQIGGSGIGESLARTRRQLTARDATVGQRLKGAAAQIVVPFSSVPDVILTRGAKRIPGVNELVTVGEAAAAAARGDMVASKRAAASGMLATMTNLAIYAEVQEGNITGSGPDDPAKKAALMHARDANGNPLWRPNSIKVGDQWVPYSSIGGVAVQIGAIANAVEQYEYAGKQVDPDMAKAWGGALSDTITDAWYLQTLAGAFRSIQTGNLPEWAGGQALSTAGRAIPESAFLNTVKKLTDPTAREAEPKLADPGTWLQYFQAKTPLSAGAGPIPEVKPKLDPATGRPIEEPQTIPSLLTRGTAPGEPNPVNEALARHNLGVGDAPKTITPAEGLTIAINDIEQRRFLELSGPEIEKRVLAMTRNASYQRAEPDQQRDLLQSVIADGREVAAVKLFQSLSKGEQLRRLREYEAAQKRQAEPAVRLP